MRARALILATVLLAGCGSGATDGSASPTEATSSATPSAARASPAPICHDRKPPWIAAASHPNDGAPDPAGRIVFGVFDHDDPVLGQIVAPLIGIDPDGSDLALVLDCDVYRPRISHDGTRLAFSIAMDDGSSQVATSAIDGSDLRILSSVDGWAEWPDWGPDDSWLSFALTERCEPLPDCIGEPTTHDVIWRMAADGSGQRPIGALDQFDREPRLSPDGREVVFDRRILDPTNPVGLVLMIRDLATGAERRVFSTDYDPEHLDWSPDGKWIIYNMPGYHPPGEIIERTPADDPDATPVWLYGDDDHQGVKPAYSPDGSRIVFGCNGRLCLMDADGSNVTELLLVPGAGLNHFAWGVTP